MRSDPNTSPQEKREKLENPAWSNVNSALLEILAQHVSNLTRQDAPKERLMSPPKPESVRLDNSVRHAHHTHPLNKRDPLERLIALKNALLKNPSVKLEKNVLSALQELSVLSALLELSVKLEYINLANAPQESHNPLTVSKEARSLSAPLVSLTGLLRKPQIAS